MQMAFPNAVSPQGLHTLGVPQSVDRVVVTVKTNGKALHFDASGQIVKSGGSDLVLTPTQSSATLKLPTGLNYTVDYSAQKSSQNNLELAWAEDTFTLTADKTLTPGLKTIIDKVELVKPETATFAANQKYPVRLLVTAPDGSPVPSNDYSVSYAVDANTDASIIAGSAQGTLVQLGLVTDTTVSATLQGLHADHTSGSFAPVSTSLTLGTANVNISADLAAPVINTSSLTVSYNGDGSVNTIHATAQDNVEATSLVVYKDVEVIATASSSNWNGTVSFDASVNPGQVLMPGDTVMVYAYDEAGNESQPFMYVIPNRAG
ncbi:hypothetical protein DEIPH_ctg026orf0066 [Deinococcus phoenicis]|uniref:Uncharacterized protein n=1 Tax=Deinococcus phoenicis TaxID=1476583 RepID=A0A016QPV0_9DEIO|nr:hypothetical protein DEIPH_ctg026orf0066 [Deinococcus phoenicis]